MPVAVARLFVVAAAVAVSFSGLGSSRITVVAVVVSIADNGAVSKPVLAPLLSTQLPRPHSRRPLRHFPPLSSSSPTLTSLPPGPLFLLILFLFLCLFLFVFAFVFGFVFFFLVVVLVVTAAIVAEVDEALHLLLLLIALLVALSLSGRFGLGVPAGLFVPSLLTGAALGRWVGEVLNRTPEWLIPEAWAHPSVYALVGASAMLAGVGRTRN